MSSSKAITPRPRDANPGAQPSGSVSEVSKTADSSAPGPEGSRLEAPPTTRQPLSPQGDVRARREVQGQVGLRARAPRVGRRQKKLKTENVDSLTRLERPAFARIQAQLGEVLAAVRPAEGQSAELSALDARLAPHRDALWTGVQQALRGTRSGLTRSGIDTLRTTGVDALVFRALVDGQLSHDAVESARATLMDGLKAGRLPVADVKKALVTADGLLQRLQLAGFPVRHPHTNNGPRDLLMVFASALHR